MINRHSLCLLFACILASGCSNSRVLEEQLSGTVIYPDRSRAIIDTYFAGNEKDPATLYLGLRAVLMDTRAPLQSRFNVAGYMIQRGADPNTGYYADTLLSDIATNCSSSDWQRVSLDDRIATLFFLVNSGADPDLVIGTIQQHTALHNAAGALSYYMSVYQPGWTQYRNCAGHPRIYAALIKAGANPALKTRWSADSSGPVSRDDAETLFRLVHVEKQHDRNWAKAEGSQFGEQLFALAAGAMLSAGSDMSSAQKADFMSAYTRDVLTNANGENMRQWQAAEMAKLNPSGGANSGGGASAPMKEESYTFKCPMGRSENTVKVPYYTQACLQAAKTFTRAYACNLIDEMEAAKSSCSSACGDPTCLERPK